MNTVLIPLRVVMDSYEAAYARWHAEMRVLIPLRVVMDSYPA